MKPRIFARSLPGRPLRIKWLISCPCFSTKRAIAAVATWDAALTIAALHWEAEHTTKENA